jgi:hypothetical protein
MQYVHLRERGGGRGERKGRRERGGTKMKVTDEEKNEKITTLSVCASYLPMIIAANGVSEAQIVHILKEIFFFLSAVAVMFCFSSEVQIRAV